MYRQVLLASCLLSAAAAAYADDKCPVRGGQLVLPFSVDPGDLTPSKKAQFPPSQI